MLQLSTIPKTPEEIAISLKQLTENERYMVKGMIIGIQANHWETTADNQREPQQPST